MGTSVTASLPRRGPLLPALRGWPLMAALYAVLGSVILYPLYLVGQAAVTQRGGFSLLKLQAVFRSPSVRAAVGNTLAIGLASVVIAGVIGVALAWLIGRTDMPLKRVLDPLNMVPFYLSSVVGALSWQVVASPRTGLLNVALAPLLGAGAFNIYSLGGIALVLGLYYAPFVYLFTLGSLQAMDASLEEAARMSGASALKTALRVTLPLAAPAILSALLLVFVTSMGIFGVPQVLGVPGRIQTLPTLIYGYVNNYPSDYATAAVLAGILLLASLLLTLVQLRVLARRRFTTVTGKGYRPRTVALGRWRWAAFAANAAYLVLVFVPFGALLLVSFQDAWTGRFEWSRLTLHNYAQVLLHEETARRGLQNTAVIATVGATLAVSVCLGLALVLQRTALRGRGALAMLLTVPVTVPGIVLGTGFLLACIGTPLYGTIWVIMLAYVVHYLPTGVRNAEALVQAVSRELDESARMSGGTWCQAVRHVLLPLVAPGLASVWLLLFVTFVREVSASMMLFTFGTETMSIALIRIMSYGAYGTAAAFGVMQTALLLLCVTMLRLVPGTRVR